MHFILADAKTAPESSPSDKVGYSFDKNGFYPLNNGSKVFVYGDQLVGSCGRPYILMQKYPLHVQTGSVHSLGNMASILLLAPHALLVFAFVLAIALRSVILKSGADFQAALYIIGPSGKGKTTLAKRIAGFIANPQTAHAALFHDAGSTNAALHDWMYHCHNLPIIVDDLCKSSSPSVEQKRRAVGSQLVRESTNAASFTKMKSNSESVQLNCNAGVILTAEFSLETVSDITRCIYVPVAEQLHLPSALTSELCGSATVSFLGWFVKNGNQALGALHHNLASIHESEGEMRVDKNMTILKWVFECFVQAAEAEGLDKDSAIQLRHLFESECSASRAVQKKQLDELDRQKKKGNLPWILLDCYQEKCFRLGSKKKHLLNTNKDGILYKNDLCLKGASLEQFVCEQDGYHNYSLHQIGSELQRSGALRINEKNCFPVKLGTDKHGRCYPRVSHIRLDVLQDEAQSFASSGSAAVRSTYDRCRNPCRPCIFIEVHGLSISERSIPMLHPITVSAVVSTKPELTPSELKAKIARIRQEFDRPLKQK